MSRIRSFALMGAAAVCIALSVLGISHGFSVQDRAGAVASPDAPTPGQEPRTPPQLSGTPQTVATAGSPWRFQPAASATDGNALKFSVTNAPVWADFNPGSGRLEGTPRDADVGTHSNIVVSVTDGSSSASLAPFSVEVRAQGASPAAQN
jgi:large repetitive protein